MWRTDWLEKTQMLGRIEGRRRGWQDEMVGWHHWLNGHDFEQTLGDSEGQGSLVCCSPWGPKESDMTEQLSTHSQVPETGLLLRALNCQTEQNSILSPYLSSRLYWKLSCNFLPETHWSTGFHSLSWLPSHFLACFFLDSFFYLPLNVEARSP